MKVAVEEAESEALLEALEGSGPGVTSVVGEIETVRVCRRAGVPPEQVDAVRHGLVIVALDDEVRRLAATLPPGTLRTVEAVHLATAISLRHDLERLLTYDTRLADAAHAAGITVAAPA